MKFVFSKNSKKYLKECDSNLKNRLFEGIYRLSDNPFPAGKKFKRLINTKPPKYRLRIGEYRVFYSVDFEAQTIFIRDIFHGHDGYR